MCPSNAIAAAGKSAERRIAHWHFACPLNVRNTRNECVVFEGSSMKKLIGIVSLVATVVAASAFAIYVADCA
jgi:hypothetical protein